MRARRRRGPAWLALALVLATVAHPAQGELVYFKAGGRAQIPATIRGETVELATPDGPRTFDRSDFLEIVPGHDPAKQWPTRLDAARKLDPAARFAAAWWAVENGLTAEATALLIESHAAGPRHEPTARLVAALGRLDAAIADPDLAPIRRALGPGDWREARGPHVVLFHRHADAEARERVEVIEKVVVAFYLTFAGMGIDLPAPRARLASAYLARKADYLALLHAQHADAFLTTRGYHHPTLDAVFAFDARDDDRQRATRAAVDRRRAEVDASAASIARLPPRGAFRLSISGEPPRTLRRAEAVQAVDRLRRDVDRQGLILDLDWRAVDLGTAAHETIHQLSAGSGLARRFDAFPVWLHEGLAAQFEVVRGGRWAGVGRAHDIRLPDWREISPRPRLAPLVADVGFGRGYRKDRYAEAWALVHHLRADRPDGFVTFLDLLRAHDRAGVPDPSRVSTCFRAALGDDMPALEAAWLRSVDALQTPLEAESP